jgi:hypothetical protein
MNRENDLWLSQSGKPFIHFLEGHGSLRHRKNDCPDLATRSRDMFFSRHKLTMLSYSFPLPTHIFILFGDDDDGGSTHLWHIGLHLWDYMAPHIPEGCHFHRHPFTGLVCSTVSLIPTLSPLSSIITFHSFSLPFGLWSSGLCSQIKIFID